MAKLRVGPALEIVEGSDDSFTLQIKKLNGTVEDVTNSIVTLYISKQPCSEVLLTKSTSDVSEAVKVTAASGIVKFIFVPADTMGTPLEKGSYFYDVWIETIDELELPTMLPTPFTVHCGVGRS